MLNEPGHFLKQFFLLPKIMQKYICRYNTVILCTSDKYKKGGNICSSKKNIWDFFARKLLQSTFLVKSPDIQDNIHLSALWNKNSKLNAPTNMYIKVDTLYWWSMSTHVHTFFFCLARKKYTCFVRRFKVANKNVDITRKIMVSIIIITKKKIFIL